MTQELGAIFGELGITQYLDAFVEQGFDTWDTILDITESDLDALGVKLGHRRKLQRRIANSRGLAPVISLAASIAPAVPVASGPPTQQTAPNHEHALPHALPHAVSVPLTPAVAAEDARTETPKPETRKVESRASGAAAGTVGGKRKYRRHPKPDENAPERPPSAYVLFSNKMRDDLKGRNLTFTEIAKLVGENWQSLATSEKEPFERQAQLAKDKYSADLAQYKKTPEFRKYNDYLQDFKAKHGHSTQDKEACKRLKLSDSGSGAGTGTSTGSSSGTPNRESRSGSGSEGNQGSEPPPSRQQRVASIISAAESQLSNDTKLSNGTDAVHSPASTVPGIDRFSTERSPSFSMSPREMAPMLNASAERRPLPPLADMFDTRTAVANGDMNGYPFPKRAFTNGGPGPPLGLVRDGRPPSLRQEGSSSGSVSSGSTVASGNYPRTPVDGMSLPIHALLTAKPGNSPPAPVLYSSGMPMAMPAPGPPETMVPFAPPGPPPNVSPLTNGAIFPGPGPGPPPSPFYHGSPGYPASVALPRRSLVAPPSAAGSPTGPGQEAGLDGMSALLRAGEIVDRRTR